jgi:hypothetical protein
VKNKDEKLDKVEIEILRTLSLLKNQQINIGYERFMDLLSKKLMADRFYVKALKEILGHFDTETDQFIPRFKEMMSIIGDDQKRRNEFISAIDSFRPGRRGPKKGGLKSFHKEFRKEWDIKLKKLKKYSKLRKSKEELIQKKQDLLERLKHEIPKDIKDNIYTANYSDLAIDWMLRYYPCSKSTLQQIIYRTFNTRFE